MKHILTFLFVLFSATGQAEEYAYQLNYSNVSGGVSTYEATNNIVVNDVTWNVLGVNTSGSPWIVGGKDMKKTTERYLYNSTLISGDVSSITLEHGGKYIQKGGEINLESFKLNVYSTAELAKAGKAGDIYTMAFQISESGKLVITHPDGGVWTDCYYRFSYYVTNGTSSNAGIKLNSITFHADVHLRVTSADKYGTLCLPRAVAADAIENATVYNIVGTQKEGDNIMGIVLEEVEGDLVAGKPYIFKANAENVKFTMNGDGVNEAKEAMGLIGNLSKEPISYEDGYYVLSNNLLHKLNGGTASVKQYRAIIDLHNVPEYEAKPGEIRKLEIIGCNVSTNIQSLSLRTIPNVMHDMQGRRIQDIPAKGLYITNGKVYVK